MVHHKVDDQPDAPLMALRDQLLKVIQIAVFRVNILIVRHVILVIGRRRHDRHKPDPVTSEIRIGRIVSVIDIIEFIDQPSDISDPIPIAVRKAV